MTLHTFFSAGPVKRDSLLRTDSAALAELLGHPDTRFIALWQSRCMIVNDGPMLLTRAELGSGWRTEFAVHLGTLHDRPLFAVALHDSLPADGPAEDAFANHGSLLAMASADDGAVLAYAKGMIEWQQRHLYCGLCGSPNRAQDGGFVMTCTNPDCDGRSFPRVDPAVIMLVIYGDRALLGRQARWPEKRFSTIAGFVEPGESMEDAVRREVAEETGVLVGDVHYLGSQPWPFPSAMMIGFHATATSTDITLHDKELAEAGWFTREDLVNGAVNIPPDNSIAFRLIEAWFDQWDGPRLAELNISSSFSRSTGAK